LNPLVPRGCAGSPGEKKDGPVLEKNREKERERGVGKNTGECRSAVRGSWNLEKGKKRGNTGTRVRDTIEKRNNQVRKIKGEEERYKPQKEEWVKTTIEMALTQKAKTGKSTGGGTTMFSPTGTFTKGKISSKRKTNQKRKERGGVKKKQKRRVGGGNKNTNKCHRQKRLSKNPRSGRVKEPGREARRRKNAWGVTPRRSNTQKKKVGVEGKNESRREKTSLKQRGGERTWKKG